jgi:hypothetical protein
VKTLDKQETALGVFLDIEVAFNNTSFDSMCAALVRQGVDYSTVWWIGSTLEDRPATATLNGSFMMAAVSRGCPQGGVLSPLLWCLAVDDIIARLNWGGVYTQSYADNMRLLVVGKFPNLVSGLMQWASTPNRLGVARSVCQLILTKLNSFSQGKGNFLVSSNLFSFGLPCTVLYWSNISG